MSDYGRVVIWETDDHHEHDYIRVWDDTLPVLLFVMLNPASGENENDKPDVTTKRCIGYARRAGYGGVRFLNLYTWRTTFPSDLWEAAEPVSERADEILRAAFADADKAVVGWGSDIGPLGADRVATVRRLAAEAGCKLMCVRLNKDGSPAHPSRGAYGPLQPWPGPA